MAVFVQGRHQHQRGSVARLMIVRSREAAPRSEVTTTGLAVSRVCGPRSPGYTCALGRWKRRHPGFDCGLNYILSVSEKTASLSNILSHRRLAGEKVRPCWINGAIMNLYLMQFCIKKKKPQRNSNFSFCSCTTANQFLAVKKYTVP